MRRFNGMAAAALVIVGLFSLAGKARATVYSFTGHFCQPETDAESAYTEYTGSGVKNTNTGAGDTLLVYCPVGGYTVAAMDTRTVDMNEARLYYDDNSDTSFFGYVLVKQNDFTSYQSATRYTCASSLGGCSTDSSPSSTTTGYLQWTGSNLPNSGSSMTNVMIYHLKVWIPQTDGGVSSYVLGYLVEH